MPLKTNGEKPNDIQLKIHMGYLPGGPVSKNPPANAVDSCLLPGLVTKPVQYDYWANQPRGWGLQQEKPLQREAQAPQ